MITRDCILSAALDWKSIIKNGLIAGVPIQPEETQLFETLLTKTVEEFINDFRWIMLEICMFIHERPDGPYIFTACPLLWKNGACGHPRLIRAKLTIGITLLHLTWSIVRREFENLNDQIFSITEPFTGADARAGHGYHQERTKLLAPQDSPTGQKMSQFQWEFWPAVIALRDEIVQKLEIIFK